MKYMKWLYMVFIFELRFFDSIKKVGPSEIRTSCLPCTRSNHWAIWPNDEMCLMVYSIKWPRSVYVFVILSKYGRVSSLLVALLLGSKGNTSQLVMLSFNFVVSCSIRIKILLSCHYVPIHIESTMSTLICGLWFHPHSKDYFPHQLNHLPNPVN